MRVFLLTILCAVALKGVIAEDENEVKRGAFRFMAFLYYPDETILEHGERFTRSAALISSDWLISSSDVLVEFPQKTLLARMGAINIDKNITLNEDEEEQEREIILILRPHNYTATQWWKTDISLLKTLLPFNITSSVASATLVSNPDISDKNCYILVYARRYNATERTLIQKNVDLLPPTQDNCGNYIEKDTMACAAESDKNAVEDPHFCQGNKGGPLVCDNELTGLQTYINDCKQPHLYQLITAWKKLITCATKQRYQTQACADVCVVISKDPPSSPTPDSPSSTEAKIGEMVSVKLYPKSQSIYSESIDTQPNTEATENSPTTKVEKPTFTSEIETKSVVTKINEERRMNYMPANTSVLIENYSQDITTTEVAYKEEEAMVDSTDERDRKNQIEAQQQIVRSEASIYIPSLYNYIMISVSILAYT